METLARVWPIAEFRVLAVSRTFQGDDSPSQAVRKLRPQALPRTASANFCRSASKTKFGDEATLPRRSRARFYRSAIARHAHHVALAPPSGQPRLAEEGIWAPPAANALCSHQQQLLRGYAINRRPKINNPR
jgi:hypothetical protein